MTLYPGAFIDSFTSYDAVIDNYETDLPVGKGVSSSAAVCVLVVRAMAYLLGVGPLTVSEEMDLAYRGERLTPSQCGRMDQCVAFGTRPVLMTFRSNEENGDDAAKVDVDCRPVHIS
eukprot:CAMPEP_0176460658 /NCGR_PEP_ID=MMETSP0127-20121128/34117_1 /TAXON_ID=938130 /ORGANISM="Platyophrya macrostoma, Strain WH" /LENGTH=116 /DNA_ID=CAMNT_0017852055 /DNA_START=242 /DNA_END=588 /DNA_ORIENTATION=+